MIVATFFKSWSLRSVVIIIAFLTACKSPPIVTAAVNDASNLESFMKGHVHYHRLVWDPTGRTFSMFNISSASPLYIILIRRKAGNCEVFFLRLKGVLPFKSMIACVGELSASPSAERFKQNCNWVNNSGQINLNQGNIYGMQYGCGPWYLTVYAPGIANTTELSIDVSVPYDPLVFRWFRVITNLAFMPAIFVGLKRRFYAETMIYTLTFILSGVYHLCEAELHCFKGYSRLHYSDYYASDLSIIATIWAMTRLATSKRHILLIAVAILLQFAVTETLRSSYHFYINLVFAGPGLLYVCSQYVFRTVKYGRIYPSARRWVFNLLPGYLLATTGAVINLIITGSENYYYVHCIWHITIMLSVAFLLPVPTDDDMDEM